MPGAAISAAPWAKGDSPCTAPFSRAPLRATLWMHTAGRPPGLTDMSLLSFNPDERIDWNAAACDPRPPDRALRSDAQPDAAAARPARIDRVGAVQHHAASAVDGEPPLEGARRQRLDRR